MFASVEVWCAVCVVACVSVPLRVLAGRLRAPGVLFVLICGFLWFLCFFFCVFFFFPPFSLLSPFCSRGCILAERQPSVATVGKIARELFPGHRWHERSAVFTNRWVERFLARQHGDKFVIKHHRAVEDRGQSHLLTLKHVSDTFEAIEVMFQKYNIVDRTQVCRVLGVKEDREEEIPSPPPPISWFAHPSCRCGPSTKRLSLPLRRCLAIAS